MARTLDWETFLVTAAGRTTVAWEEGAFARFVANKTGDRALQIGLWKLNALDKSPIGHRIAAADVVQALDADDLRVRLIAQSWALPLKDESCDLVVWPHGLDMCPDKAQATLAEITRVLAPNGLLVLSFFNPMGAWHLRQNIFCASKILPDRAAGFSMMQAKALIAQTGLTLEGGNFGVYAVNPNVGQTNVRLPSWIDKAGDRWWPTLSNVIVLSARKTDAGLKLVGKVNFAPAKATKTVGAIASKQMQADANSNFSAKNQ